MSFTNPTYPTNNVTQLPSIVEEQEALLKQKFDQASIDIKAYQIAHNVELEASDLTNTKLTGNQTVAGVKTFTSSPIVPTPTTDFQASTKIYVDSKDTTQTGALTTHKTSADHDSRYYTETEINAFAVKLTGNQTIAGIKTFSSSPLVPVATTNTQAPQKVYVDDALALKANDNAVVKLTSNQSIADVKTFTSSPIVPTPTNSTQVASKGYVDGHVVNLQSQVISNDVDISALQTSKANTTYVNSENLKDVKLTGNQSIAGVKTFTSSPIVPTPTTATQTASKGYVDTTIGDSVLGEVPDGSLTDVKLSNTAGQIKDRVTDNANATGSIETKTDFITVTQAVDLDNMATTVDYTVTIPSTSWTGTEPVTKSVTVASMLSTDTPVWGYVPTGTYATDLIIKDNAGLILGIETLNGSITVTATEPPSANIPIILKVVR